MERSLLPAAHLRCVFYPMAPPASLRGVLLLLIATLRCVALMLRTRPRVTFATGGYVSVPAAVSSWLLRVPLVVFLPDTVPGKAVTWLLPLARRIAVITADAARGLPPEKVVITGYPVRESFIRMSRVSGRAALNLPVDARVVCVFGGSQGARSINEALARILPQLLTHTYVIHICGEKRRHEAEAAVAHLSDDLRSRYRLYAYLGDEEMAAAIAAADLVVCRSGASTLGELPAVGTPAILVPFPDPAVHQQENAAFLARQDAAVVIHDNDLNQLLGPTIQSLFQDESRLLCMKESCRALARTDAAAAIAHLIMTTGAA